jgi:eukaryotic-like serine/threonine-protein kinase
MAAIAADRDLLFGMIALQNGLIDQGQLVAAFHAWTRDKGRPLAEHLVARGDLDADQRAGVDAMVALHVKKHGGDAAKSLAAIPAGPSTRESLARVGDSYLEASLALVRPASTQAGEDVDRTSTFSVGSPTSDGQRFRILRPHARGGLGAVFVALDSELHREVALKQILDDHADDPTSRQRFLLEAEVTGGLEHPGIVPVYGLGSYGDGRPYYAMRFIRGDSLKEAIGAFHSDDTLRGDPGRRSLGLLKLLRRFLAVCDAIDYAHSRGILHRDLKPANVVLGKHGETLVVDWGLAKSLRSTESEAASDERILVPSSSSGSAETLPGSALGTPRYMSPEQAGGHLDRLGSRSDVYSLGATLYSLLTGQAPVEDDDVAAVLRAVQKGDFPPPRRLDPAIDPALEAVCLKAMALRPEDRYVTPRALAEDIEHWMADEPVSAWHEPRARQARRWARRHRTAVTAAISTVLMTLAGMTAVLAVQARANSELKQSNAALAAANDRERARFALAMDAVKLFHGEVSEDFLLKEKPFEALRTKLLRGAADFYNRLEGLLKGQSDRPSRTALARAYDELAELTEKIGSKPEALAMRRQALAVHRELADSPEADVAARVDVARSLIAVGSLQQETGDAAGTLASYEEARQIAEELAATVGGDDAQLQAVLGLAHHRIGRLLQDTGRPTEALASYERALAIQRKLAAAHPDVIQYQGDLAEGLFNMGYFLSVTGKPAEALAWQERSLMIRQKLVEAHPSLPQFQSDLAPSYTRVGYMQHLTGKSAEALKSYERALVIYRELVEAHPNVTEFQFQQAASHDSIAWVLRQTGEPVEALAAFERAIAIHRQLVDAHPSVIRFQNRLALCLAHAGGLHLEAGRPAKAAAALRQSVAILERLPTLRPSDRYNLACGHADLAGIATMPGSGMTAAEGQAEAERAMQWLHRAVAAGYRNVALMQRDHDIDALRSRPDFQLLMMDLAFPDDPFVAAR